MSHSYAESGQLDHCHITYSVADSNHFFPLHVQFFQQSSQRVGLIYGTRNDFQKIWLGTENIQCSVQSSFPMIFQKRGFWCSFAQSLQSFVIRLLCLGDGIALDYPIDGGFTVYDVIVGTGRECFNGDLRVVEILDLSDLPAKRILSGMRKYLWSSGVPLALCPLRCLCRVFWRAPWPRRWISHNSDGN